MFSAGSDAVMTLNDIQFPVLPPHISVTAKQNNGTVHINNFGEFSMLGKTTLKTVSFSAFFPAQQYDFCMCNLDGSPNDYVSQIETMRTNNTICQFSISGTPINMTCTIESFVYGYNDGTDDISFTISLKEYRYVEGTAPKEINKKLGLNQRPESFLQKVGKNVTYYPGENCMDTISRAIGKAAGQTKSCKPYLQQYASIVRDGGIKPGNVLSIKNGKMSITDVLNKTTLH
jgi:hypothetical protein